MGGPADGAGRVVRCIPCAPAFHRGNHLGGAALQVPLTLLAHIGWLDGPGPPVLGVRPIAFATQLFGSESPSDGQSP